MKKSLLSGLLLFLTAGSLHAQEAIYLANGNRSSGRITGAEGEKIKITVNRNGKPAQYSLRRENVLVAFADDGRYLLINMLDADPIKAQQEIDAFQKGTAPRLTHDLLIKIAPVSVLTGTIRYESDQVVNYQSVSGAAASVSKKELAAIIYRDGRHQLLMPPADALPTLQSTLAEVIRLSMPTVAPMTTAKKMPKLPPSSAKNAAKAPAKVSEPPKASPPEPVANRVPDRSSAPGVEAVSKPKLSDAQYQQYRASALNRVDEFVTYLNVIANKDLDDDAKDKAIDEAVKLFMPSATIDVSSANRPGVRKYKIKDYLTRLKTLPYASTTIDWTEIQYVSELKQAADGAYYGLITGQQTFTGYAENGKDVLYTDVTEKSVQVKLEAYKNFNDGVAKLKWAVLLGNIGLNVK